MSAKKPFLERGFPGRVFVVALKLNFEIEVVVVVA